MDRLSLRAVVVEDNDNEFRDIADALRQNILGTSGRVDRARSYAEYLELQRTGVYDIVILDIHLQDCATGEEDSDEEGGIRVSGKLRVLNPGAVVVLFSHWVDVRKTVQAMRNGAWDCISKQEDPRKQMLVASVRAGLAAPFFQRDWFLRNAERLMNTFGGEYIAVSNNEVIAHSRTLEEVRQELRRTIGLAKDEATIDLFLVPTPKSKHGAADLP